MVLIYSPVVDTLLQLRLDFLLQKPVPLLLVLQKGADVLYLFKLVPERLELLHQLSQRDTLNGALFNHQMDDAQDLSPFRGTRSFSRIYLLLTFWESSPQNKVKDDPQGVNVELLHVVRSFPPVHGQQFRRSVFLGEDRRRKLIIFVESRGSEVAENDLHLRTEEKVFQLEIPVTYMVTGEVGVGVKDVPHQLKFECDLLVFDRFNE